MASEDTKPLIALRTQYEYAQRSRLKWPCLLLLFGLAVLLVIVILFPSFLFPKTEQSESALPTLNSNFPNVRPHATHGVCLDVRQYLRVPIWFFMWLSVIGSDACYILFLGLFFIIWITLWLCDATFFLMRFFLFHFRYIDGIVCIVPKLHQNAKCYDGGITVRVSPCQSSDKTIFSIGFVFQPTNQYTRAN